MTNPTFGNKVGSRRLNHLDYVDYVVLSLLPSILVKPIEDEGLLECLVVVSWYG